MKLHVSLISGFDGKKCEKLSSVRFSEPDSYIRLSPISYGTRMNITLVLVTRKQEGVVLYHGFDKHIAVEVFRGRLRVSFDIGNYPVSTMFSYEQISDDARHVIELLIAGKNFSMRIDGGQTRTIINEGERRSLDLGEPLYLGGLPGETRDGAFKKWHIRNTASFSGMYTSCKVDF